jgi:hypothetical protein
MPPYTPEQLQKQRERRERIKEQNGGKLYDEKQKLYTRRYAQKKAYAKKISELERLMKEYADEHALEIDHLEQTSLIQQVLDTQEYAPKKGRPKKITLPPELFPQAEPVAPVEQAEKKRRRGRPRKVLNSVIDDYEEKQQLEIQHIANNMTIETQTLDEVAAVVV